MSRNGNSKFADFRSVAHRRRQSQAQVAAFTSRMRVPSGLSSLDWNIEEEDLQSFNAEAESSHSKGDCNNNFDESDEGSDPELSKAGSSGDLGGAETPLAGDVGTDEVHSTIFTKGLLKTSLQLIDERSQNLKMIENMLLPMLDQLVSNGGGKQNAQNFQQLAALHEWALGQFSRGCVSLPGSSRYDVRLCGWLGKLGRSGTKVQRRWVELSGQTLSYFAENNGLELRGCLDLDACRCTPLPRTNRGGYSFELSAEPGKVIKKVHSRTDGKYKQKKSYRFWMTSEEELNMWTVAIQEAINQPELRRVKETCARFAAIDGTQRDKYIDELFALSDKMNISSSDEESASGRPLLFPCDWLHQQVLLKGSDSKEGPVEDNRHEAKSLDQVYKDFVRDTVVIDGTIFECEDGDVIIEDLFTKIYQKFAEFHGLEKSVGESKPRSNNRHLHKFMDHYIMRNALAYARAVLMASCRTVSGGDTYDAVDFMLHNNDIAVICPDSGFIAPVKIMVHYGKNGQDEAETGTKAGQEEARVNAVPEEHVCEEDEGAGDTSFHLEESSLAEPQPRTSRLRKLSEAIAPRKKLGLKSLTVGATSTNFEPSLKLEKSASMSKLVKVDSSRQSKMNALRSRFGGSQPTMRSGNGVKIGHGTASTTASKPRGSKGNMEEIEDEFASMRWPHVRVHVESRYRVMDADPMDEDPTLARIHTTFSRTFSWGRHTYCKPGEVSVRVLGRAEDAELVRRATQLSSIASISEASTSATDELVSRETTTF